jgi:hypothetical protein
MRTLKIGDMLVTGSTKIKIIDRYQGMALVDVMSQYEQHLYYDIGRVGIGEGNAETYKPSAGRVGVRELLPGAENRLLTLEEVRAKFNEMAETAKNHAAAAALATEEHETTAAQRLARITDLRGYRTELLESLRGIIADNGQDARQLCKDKTVAALVKDISCLNLIIENTRA